jgi:hypothetical protein
VRLWDIQASYYGDGMEMDEDGDAIAKVRVILGYSNEYGDLKTI